MQYIIRFPPTSRLIFVSASVSNSLRLRIVYASLRLRFASPPPRPHLALASIRFARAQRDGKRVILEPTARVSIIASGSSRNLRPNPHTSLRQNLRIELIAAAQNPSNLLDSTPYSPSSDDDFFSEVPTHLARHNNLSPHSPHSPSLTWLFDNPPSPISPPSSSPQMATPTPMPARGDRNAPTFDADKPHELRRYFTDLEFLFGRAAVTDNTEKKKHATRFLAVDDQETWEALAAFADVAKTYEQFKADVLKLYSGNDEERRYGLQDLDALVGHISRTGIYSKADVTTFYRQFLRITTYLVSKNRLSASEQSRSFLRAMQPASLLVKVEQRLQIKRPDVHPEDPYDLADIYDAALFVLAGFTSTLAPAPPLPSPAPAAAPVDIKPDPGIAALVGTVSKLIEVLVTRDASSTSGGGSNDTSGTKKTRPDGCGYCSDLDHFINQCNLVIEDIKAGICQRNTEGRVVLPNGSFIPRAIIGKNLRARFQEWHKQNPGHLAAAQLMVEVAVEHLSSSSSPTSARTYALTDDERLDTLKREMLAIQTRRQAKRALDAAHEEPDHTISPSHAPTSASNAPATPTASALAAPSNPAPDTPTPTHAAPPQPPFSNARDAAYAPPKDRNFGLPPPKGPAYRTTAPIYNEKDAADVFDASLNAEVRLTQRQLLSLAPEVRARYREETTSRRAPPKDNKPAETLVQQFLQDFESPFPHSADFALESDTIAEQRAKDARRTALLDSMPSSFTTSATTQSELPSGAFVVPDPYAIYYDSGSVPDDLIVSMESCAIRSILPVIDNREVVECIVDGGSQIIAMSESVCHELALSYDPRIILRMQSANGSVTPSLGLSRNVPFRIGDITLYLQVHIVRNPAYDVLLGHPFHVLTQSIVRTFANEDQTITICDPNTGNLATVPTVPRGPPRSRPQGFPNDPRSHNSRT
ncbi:hypothetical protein C8R44DRAFT_726576 [Mycena epipterygia]|nr:hypothetical protein C8R44DRAFT_726576 [Mycena epipterygia]